MFDVNVFNNKQKHFLLKLFCLHVSRSYKVHFSNPFITHALIYFQIRLIIAVNTVEIKWILK